VENDLLGLDLSVLHIDLISNQNDWNILANSHEILVPFWYILVSNSGTNVKHNDCALTTNTAKVSEIDLLVSISESTKLLLTCCVPDIEFDSSMIGIENHWVNFNP
jgi:hypothetical protein